MRRERDRRLPWLPRRGELWIDPTGALTLVVGRPRPEEGPAPQRWRVRCLGGEGGWWCSRGDTLRGGEGGGPRRVAGGHRE